MIAPVELAAHHRSGMPAPAPRRVVRGAAADGVVEEAEKRDSYDVGEPAAQVGIEEIDVGAVVEHRERRERHQRGREQDRPERKGDARRAVVLARHPGLAQRPDPGGQDREPDP